MRADRKQRYVKISGMLHRRPELRPKPYRCTCLLAPENPRDGEGRSKWCDPDCNVEILHRIYVNCTEKEVLDSLLDYRFLKVDPTTLTGLKKEERSIQVFEVIE